MPITSSTIACCRRIPKLQMTTVYQSVTQGGETTGVRFACADASRSNSMGNGDCGHNIFMRRVSRYRPVPYASSVGSDIDLRRIERVHEHTVTPFEVVARDAFPVQAAIQRPKSTGIEPADI